MLCLTLPPQLGYRYAKSQRERKSKRDHPVPSLQAVLTYVKNYNILLNRRKAAVSRLLEASPDSTEVRPLRRPAQHRAELILALKSGVSVTVAPNTSKRAVTS